MCQNYGLENFMNDIKHDVIATLVLLEKKKSRSFFDTMTNLVEELDFCGPMHTH